MLANVSDDNNYIFSSEISYQLVLDVESASDENCDGLNRDENEDESIEFAVRTSSLSDAPWIPLQLHYYTTGGDVDSTSSIRGYSVPTSGRTADTVTGSVDICGDLLQDANEVQFRWMGTSFLDNNAAIRSDMWALANVAANLVIGDESVEIFRDNFGSDNLK